METLNIFSMTVLLRDTFSLTLIFWFYLNFSVLPMTFLVGILLSATIITNLASYWCFLIRCRFHIQYTDSYYDRDFDGNRDTSYEKPDDKLQTRINKIVGEYKWKSTLYAEI